MDKAKPVTMKVVICTLGLGHHYPRGVARLIRKFHENCDGFEIQAWVNKNHQGHTFSDGCARGQRD